MNEIIFLIAEAPEGGYSARALEAAIFTDADTIPDLHDKLRDAVRCHFDEPDRPKMIRLQFVHEQVIAA